MGQPLAMYGLLEDGRIAAVDPHEEGKRDTLLAIDRKTGKSTPVEGLQRTPGQRCMRRSAIHGAIASWAWAGPRICRSSSSSMPSSRRSTARRAAAVRERLRDAAILVARSIAGVVVRRTAGDAGAYYVYETATQKLRLIGKRYPQLTAPEHLGERQSIKYKARDGTQIPAYLTLPAGRRADAICRSCCWCTADRTRATTSRSTGGRASSPRAATRCCSQLPRLDRLWLRVVRRRPRRLGRRRDADRRGRRRRRAREERDTSTRSRVCIMGGSYGGYAALAGATLTPGSLRLRRERQRA